MSGDYCGPFHNCPSCLDVHTNPGSIESVIEQFEADGMVNVHVENGVVIYTDPDEIEE